jgi:hypothetical protein
MEKLDCAKEPALEIARGFRSLSMKRSDCIKMLFQDAIYFELIRIPQPTNAYLLAKQLTEMVDQMDEVTITWENCINAENIEQVVSYDRPDSPYSEHGLDSHNWTDEQFEAVYPEDDLENNQDNPFGAFPLHHGDEAMSHEFLTMLRFASQEKLQSIIDELPKWKNGQRRNGYLEWNNFGQQYWRKYKFHYLTNSQISQIWVYIKARRKQLKSLAKSKLSQDAKMIMRFMDQNAGSKKLSAAMIYSWRDGTSFNTYGVPINWSKQPDPTELSIVWDRWHEMK